MYKERILKLLRSSKSGFLSGEELAHKLGISRTMIWKHIKALEAEGFGIEAVSSQGYRLTGEPDLLRRDDIRLGLKTHVVGREIHLYPEVVSTNTLAMEMASSGAPEGAVIIAETQTGGKGRIGRKWLSPAGNMYMSVILRPRIALQKAPLITLMGAVAAAAAIRRHCGCDAGIKWPNDILISSKKVAGLLTEMSAEQDRIRHIVLGIGIDVNMDPDVLPDEIRRQTTTLAAETGAAVDRTALLRQLLRELDQRYQIFLANDQAVLKEWELLNLTIGRRVAVRGIHETIEGLAQGIDPEGRLLVKVEDGSVHPVAAGDVTILKGR